MKKITFLSLFLLLSCSMGLLYGQNKASTPQVRGTAPAGANFQNPFGNTFNRAAACDGVLPNYTNSQLATDGVASQIFPDFGNNGMFAADDFMVAGSQDATICQVDIEGVFFGGGTTLDDPAISIRMTIYDDLAGKPDTPIFTEDFPGSIAGPSNPSFSLAPTNTPVLTAGDTYWMSVQVIMSYVDFGQWGWTTTTDGNGSAFMFQDPDDIAGSGCPSWDLGSVCTGITEPDLAMDISFNAVSSPPVVYCTASGNSTTFEHITNVTYAGINNTTTTHAGYNDFTALVANVNQGDTDQISVTITADGGDYLYAFIDWNQNGILDDAGEVYTLATSTSSSGPHTMNITVPAGASLGDTRMRVKVGWLQTTPNPCGTFSYGEVEDYTVRVHGPLVGNPPVIVCPSDITANNDAGLCSAVVNFADAIAIDVEDGVIQAVQTGGPASGSDFPVGTTTVEFTATDSDGNSVTCEFDVTVVDNEAPMAVCQNVTVDLDASGSYTLTPAEIDNGSTDNCGIAGYQLGTMGSGSYSLTTTFAGGNSLAGSMFDLEAVNDLTIDSFDVNMATGQTGDIEVYFKTGTWVGSESTPADWTLVGTATNITSAGVGLPTPLNLDLGITVAAGNRVAFYITRTSGSLTYTNGTTVGALFASDSNLQMFEGAGKGYPFGSTFQPRVFNGNIVYSVSGAMIPFSGDFDCSHVGDNDIYLIVTDNSGNVSNCMATVTVQDVTAPEVFCIGGFGTFTEYEDFEGSSIPTGWTTVIESGAQDWTFGSGVMPGGQNFPTNAAIFDDDAAGSGSGPNKARLVSPAYDLNGASNVELSFDYSIQDFAGSGTFEVEVWDGTAWQQILFIDNTDVDPTNSGIIDVSGYLNNAFQVRFTYDDEGDWAWGAGVDNFLLEYERASGGGLDVYLDADGHASISPSDLVLGVNEACGYTISASGTGGGTVGSLTTLFASGNNGSPGGAVYFDVTVGPTDIEITDIDINTGDPGSFTMDVYTLVGSYAGNEANSAAWGAPVAVGSGTGAGLDSPSNAVLDNPITLTAGTTYGMALVLDSTHSHYYTNGDGSNQNYSNADLSMALGSASNTPFSTPIFAPRIFNGTLHYIGGPGSGVDFTCADLGENIIEVTVTDDSGNEATCMAVVNVIDNIAPVITCAGTPGPVSVVEDFESNTIPSGWTSEINTGNQNWQFGSGTMPTGGSFPSKAAIFNDDAAGSGNVNKATLYSPVYNIVGSSTASISFDYAFQEFLGDGILTAEVYNGASWTQVFSVETNTNPTNTGPIDVAAYINSDFQVRFIYDDEGGWSWGAGIDNFTVNYEITAPTAIDIVLGADGTAIVDPYSLIRDIDEACDISSVAVDVAQVTCADIGAPIDVTVFVSDSSGNLASCTTMINVVDRTPPVLTCPADQTQDPGAGNLYYILPDYFATGEATAIDNCTDPVVLTTQDPAPGAALPDGVHIITLTAEDEYGNVSTCTFELTVESIIGIDENSLEAGVSLYPNPATDIVNLVNKSNIALDKMMVYDINGKLVIQTDLRNMQGEKTVDVSSLASGVYVVQIIGENASTVKRLIKD